MEFTIIIPTCNRTDLLYNCLTRLKPEVQTIKSSYQVIVSDDSRNNQTRQLISEHFQWVDYLKGPEKGPAANRNYGAKSASGEWLIFLDDDCLPEKDWIEAFQVAKRKYPETLVFEGKTSADRERRRYDEEAPLNLEGNNLWSCNFSIQKSLFINLSGFDEGFPFPAMEDVDFHFRVQDKSTIGFVQDAVVIHPWRLKKPFKGIYKHLSSHKYFLNKNCPPRDIKFRVQRAKIFLSCSYHDFFTLLKFSMKGWTSYLEDCLSNFCMIFI